MTAQLQFFRAYPTKKPILLKKADRTWGTSIYLHKNTVSSCSQNVIEPSLLLGNMLRTKLQFFQHRLNPFDCPPHFQHLGSTLFKGDIKKPTILFGTGFTRLGCKETHLLKQNTKSDLVETVDINDH